MDRYQPEHGATHLLWYGLDPKVICLGRLGITFWFLGQAESAMRAREASLRLAEEIGHPLSRGSALVFAAMLAIELRDWEGVRAYTASLAAGRADDEARFIQLSADTLSSYVEVLDRRQPTAIARIEQALEEAGEAEPAPGLYALIMRILLEAYAVVGDARAASPTPSECYYEPAPANSGGRRRIVCAPSSGELLVQRPRRSRPTWNGRSR